MDYGKKKDIKDTGQDLIIETILDVGSDSLTDAAKESLTSIIGEILIDTAGSLIPGVSGAITGYKRARFERNIKRMTDEFLARLNEIQLNLESKSQEQKNRIDDLFKYVIDFVIDEQQEEKIQFMVNGFVNITEHEQVTDDFILTYYDVLKELRMIDISVLRLMYSVKYRFDNENNETYRDIMERHGITYDQYDSVRRNLLRIGLLTTITELNITEDLDEISKIFKDLYAYLDKLTNPKFKGSLPRLKVPKFKSKDKLEISQFGRDFVRFFLEEGNR